MDLISALLATDGIYTFVLTAVFSSKKRSAQKQNQSLETTWPDSELVFKYFQHICIVWQVVSLQIISIEKKSSKSRRSYTTKVKLRLKGTWEQFKKVQKC